MASENEKKIAAQCWLAGNKAVPAENWDYAISSYKKAVKLVPDNLMYRQSLRGAEQKKFGNNGKGASMANMRLMGTRGQIKKSRMTKNWAQVADAAEDGLELNPWDAQLNADLGDACRELGFLDVAMFAYEEAIKADPANKSNLASLAHILEDRGEYMKAAACWEKVLKLDSLYQGARQKITDLSTRQTIDRGKFESSSTKGQLSAHEIADRLNKNGVDGPGASAEGDLQRAIRKDPKVVDNYIKLGDFYIREGEYEKAEEQFKIALQASGNNVDIRQRLEDVQLDMLRQNIEAAKNNAAANPDEPDLKKKTGELARELLSREIEIFSGRVERYPQDMRLKFELGQRHMRVQAWQKAIPLFQQSRGDARIRGESLLALGKCFYHDGKAQLAYKQFSSALPDVNSMEHQDLFKDLHYTFARLCEEMKKTDEAIEHYQQVMEVDYGYRDVNKRLDALESGGGATAEA